MVEFSDAPSLETVQKLAKLGLLEAAAFYELPVKSSLKKPEIKSGIIEYLFGESVLDESALDSIAEVKVRDWDLKQR